jgi:glycosyltransferase involved in cell wall biosynthesis
MASKNGHPITILINALSARQGGGQTYVTNLLERVPQEFSLKIFVLAPATLSLPPDKKNLKRIPVDWPVEDPFARAIWESLCLPNLLKRLDADVLFCPGGIIGCRVPPGCKSATMFRNMIPFSDAQQRRYRAGYMRMRNTILKRVLLRSMQRADLVIFLSNYARTVIEERVQRKLRQTVTIPHGVSESFRNSTGSSPLPAQWMPSEGYLLYVSTLDYYKAQLEVVEAYASLKQRRATKEKLVLVGPEYREYGRKVRQQIKRLGLEKDVIIPGPVPYSVMPGIYQNALVNIFASECENCPNILMEALAAGRPVFSSNYPPMPEFAGDAAVYFDPKSPDDLADKLATILDDPGRMRDFGEKAAERARFYDWASTAQKTWRAIRQLATG